MRTGAVLLIVSAGLLSACDTGDGTTLRDPDPNAPPATDVPITPTTLDPAASSAAPAPTDTPSDTSADTPAESVSPMELVGPWPDGEQIDPLFGCDGSNATPALEWTGVPEGTAELAITMVNESDVSRGEPFVHWVLWGLGPERLGLAENEAPPEAFVALNFFGNVGYDGPCPDPGTTAVYRFEVHALFQQLELADGTPAAEVIDTIELLSIGDASIVGSSTR